MKSPKYQPIALGIIDWKEDYQHLQNQLLREQIGTCAGFDTKQENREKRKHLEKLREEAQKVKEIKSRASLDSKYEK